MDELVNRTYDARAYIATVTNINSIFDAIVTVFEKDDILSSYLTPVRNTDSLVLAGVKNEISGYMHNFNYAQSGGPNRLQDNLVVNNNQIYSSRDLLNLSNADDAKMSLFGTLNYQTLSDGGIILNFPKITDARYIYTQFRDNVTGRINLGLLYYVSSTLKFVDNTSGTQTIFPLSNRTTLTSNTYYNGENIGLGGDYYIYPYRSTDKTFLSLYYYDGGDNALSAWKYVGLGNKKYFTLPFNFLIKIQDGDESNA